MTFILWAHAEVMGQYGQCYPVMLFWCKMTPLLPELNKLRPHLSLHTQYLSISALYWCGRPQSRRQETCPALRLPNPELFSSVFLSSLHIFDRLVNNAGGLCDDNRLEGTHARTNTPPLFCIYMYISNPVSLLILLSEFGSLPLYSNSVSSSYLQFTLQVLHDFCVTLRIVVAVVTPAYTCTVHVVVRLSRLSTCRPLSSSTNNLDAYWFLSSFISLVQTLV